MKAAASENKKVNTKCFRGTANDLLDLYKKVPKGLLVEIQKYNATCKKNFKARTVFVGMFYQRKNNFVLTFVYVRSVLEYHSQLSIKACC